jgi:hypothetical protein
VRARQTAVRQVAGAAARRGAQLQAQQVAGVAAPRARQTAARQVAGAKDQRRVRGGVVRRVAGEVVPVVPVGPLAGAPGSAERRAAREVV